jgi:hypothetical protein
MCVYRDPESDVWHPVEMCLESSLGYYACCTDHLSTFALVTYEEVNAERFGNEAVVAICVLMGVIGIISGVLEWKKKSIMRKEQ